MIFLRRTVQLGVFLLVLVQLASLLQAFHPVLDALSQFRLQFTVLLGLGLLILLMMKSWRVAGITALSVAAGVIAMSPAVGHATLSALQQGGIL